MPGVLPFGGRCRIIAFVLVDPGLYSIAMDIELTGFSSGAQTLTVIKQDNLMVGPQLQHFVPICCNTNGRVIARNLRYTIQPEYDTLFNQH